MRRYLRQATTIHLQGWSKRKDGGLIARVRPSAWTPGMLPLRIRSGERILAMFAPWGSLLGAR